MTHFLRSGRGIHVEQKLLLSKQCFIEIKTAEAMKK
jgi:hypothetical protein